MTHRNHTTDAPPIAPVRHPRRNAPGRTLPEGERTGDRTDERHAMPPVEVERETQPAEERDRASSEAPALTQRAESDAAPRRAADHPIEVLRQRCTEQARRIAELERDQHAISHSIRSPLVALKGFAGLLREEIEGSLGENGRHFLGRITEAGRRIESRLNDAAQLLAIGEQAPSRSWIDPAPIVEGLAAEFKPSLDETGMRILLDRDPPLVYCDPAQLELALRHLIGNALQHGTPSEPRHVQIRIERCESGTRVTVTDGGPGMDETLERRAFDPFDCAGDRRRRFDEGRESTGIGLALVARIAEAHRGRASLETAPGRGTSVVVTFAHE